ncbi:uncharacterized protein LOC102681552 [Apis dorsata]|uniref:uncharacterized protein LOC102681552 n=1 Tax=Apis dorsata TaxID=7462 RepID=UPI001293DEF3|nr:uncharacterized protein LOC102681552 [Apis dorsata]
MSAKISLASRGTAQSPVNHRGKSSSGLLLAGKSVKRPSSMTVEVTGTEERAVKRAAVPELEASSSSSRPNSLLERESNMPVLTRACTTATLPRIKRFKFASFASGSRLDAATTGEARRASTTGEGKELLRRRHYREVVVYDDCTDDVDRLPVQHPLFLVLVALLDDNREPALLLGRAISVPIKDLRPLPKPIGTKYHNSSDLKY